MLQRLMIFTGRLTLIVKAIPILKLNATNIRLSVGKIISGQEGGGRGARKIHLMDEKIDARAKDVTQTYDDLINYGYKWLLNPNSVDMKKLKEKLLI